MGTTEESQRSQRMMKKNSPEDTTESTEDMASTESITADHSFKLIKMRMMRTWKSLLVCQSEETTLRDSDITEIIKRASMEDMESTDTESITTDAKVENSSTSSRSLSSVPTSSSSEDSDTTKRSTRSLPESLTQRMSERDANGVDAEERLSSQSSTNPSRCSSLNQSLSTLPSTTLRSPWKVTRIWASSRLSTPQPQSAPWLIPRDTP